MFLIFILCIIILNLSRRKVVVETTSLIQKSLNFNIFLFFSKIFLKIINFLNFLIFTIFLRIISVISMFDSHIKAIIFAALIFCIYFIFCFFLIHVINFISLLNLRFCYDYATASCFAKQLSPDCCSNGLTLDSNFYILLSFPFCIYSLCF